MSTPSLRGPVASRDSHLRAADADRESIAEQLRTGHAEGRLDLNEFQERLERCYDAKTFGELGALVSDLPRDQQPPAGPPVSRLRPRPHLVLGLIALLFVAMVASTAAWHHGQHPPFFLVFPVLFLLWRVLWLRRARSSSGGRGGSGRWA